MARAQGPDFSHWNGSYDPHVLEGTEHFVFQKASEGNSWEDELFPAQWEALADVNIFRSPYHFWRFGDPIGNAKHFRDIVGDDKGTLPPVVDLEDTRAPSGTRCTADVLTCLQNVEQEFGIKPIIYTAAWWWDPHMTSHASFAHYDLWVANYRTVYPWTQPFMPRGLSEWHFWQYTDRKDVGIPDPTCDHNYFNGDVAALQAYAGIEPTPPPTDNELEERVTELEAQVTNIEQWIEGYES